MIMKKLLKLYYNSEYTHFVSQGYLHGYPACCIQEFINKRIINHDFSVILSNNFSGFIPCTKHSNQILKGKITLTNLIQSYRCIGLPNFKEISK